MNLFDFLAAAWLSRRRRRHRVTFRVTVTVGALTALPPGIQLGPFPKKRLGTRTAPGDNRNTMTTTVTRIDNPPVQFSDDQWVNITLATTDKLGYPVAGPTPGASPAVAIEDTTGADISAQFLCAFDPDNPLSLYIASAPAVAGMPPTDRGQIVLTLATGAEEVTPFTRTRGAAVGVTETVTVGALSALPPGVTFPAPPGESSSAGGSGSSAT